MRFSQRDIPWFGGLDDEAFQRVNAALLKRACFLADTIWYVRDHFDPKLHAGVLHGAQIQLFPGVLNNCYQKPKPWEGMIVGPIGDRMHGAFWDKDRSKFHYRIWDLRIEDPDYIPADILGYGDIRDKAHIMSMEKESILTEWLKRPAPRGDIPFEWELKAVPVLTSDPFWIWNQIIINMEIDDPGDSCEGQ